MNTKKLRYLLRFMPDEPYLKLCYYLKTHKKLNLKNPQTFNEKLQWLKLYNRSPEYTTMVDKYRVRVLPVDNDFVLQFHFKIMVFKILKYNCFA